MKVLFLLGVVALVHSSFANGARDRTRDFIDQAVGDYGLAEGQSEECPRLIRITEEAEKTLRVVSSEGPGATFRRIGEGYDRTTDGFASYYDVRTAFTEEDRITSQVRTCSGLVVIRCEEWIDSQSMRLTADGVSVRFNGSPTGVACAYRQ
jgi:hypothetical protein